MFFKFQKLRYGIVGAAWGTLLSLNLGMVFLVITMYFKLKNNKDLIGPTWTLPDRKYIKQISISIFPLAVGQASKSLYYFLVNSYAGT